jgi:hypothetical protein
MKYNKTQRSNFHNLTLNRFDNDIPKEMWLEEGQHFFTKQPRLSPYAVELYKAIEYAINAGIINTGFQLKGIYDNDAAAILGGLVDGDIYELSASNTLDPDFFGLLKVVRQNVVILSQTLGTGDSNTVIGTGTPGQIIRIQNIQ